MLSERLGYGPKDKLLIVHIDDIGMCHSANVATLRALDKGITTCGAIMFPCPWVLEIAKAYRDKPDMVLGVHTTFTSEWELYRWGPVAPRDQVPSLLDAQGYLPRRTPELIGKATARDFERELRAQIERALELGFRPTHMDTHMVVPPQRRDWFECYVRLGREYGIPPQIFRPREDDYARLRAEGIDDAYFARLEAEGYPIIDQRLGAQAIGRTLDQLRADYREAFRHAKPGVSMLKLHLGMNDPELIGALGDEKALARYNDYLVWTDDATRAAAEEAGMRIIDWRPLTELFKASIKV